MREIEIKLRVNNLKEIENKLIEKGYALSEPISQHDVIYSNKSKMEEFEHSKEGDIIMRIRYLKDKTQVNLKQQQTYEMDNLEFETVVENPDEMHKILLTLGWKPVVEVRKLRRKGKLGEYEICLDEVEKLGSFIELEKLADDNDDPQKVRDELFKELEFLGLSQSDEETKGYDTQMYLLK